MNEKVQNDLGGDHSAKILMYSLEFGEFSKQERLAAAGNWDPWTQRCSMQPGA